MSKLGCNPLECKNNEQRDAPAYGTHACCQKIGSTHDGKNHKNTRHVTQHPSALVSNRSALGEYGGVDDIVTCTTRRASIGSTTKLLFIRPTAAVSRVYQRAIIAGLVYLGLAVQQLVVFHPHAAADVHCCC